MKIAGVSVPVSEQGHFTKTLTLNAGVNFIQARAVDASGNVGSANRLVIQDTLPPALTVTSPLDGDEIDGNRVLVQGYAEIGSVVTVNNSVIVAESRGAFSGWVLLSDNNFVLTIVATDAAGNSTTVVRTLEPVSLWTNWLYLPVILRTP